MNSVPYLFSIFIRSDSETRRDLQGLEEMPDETPKDKTQKKSWFRYSLRTLLIVSLVIGLLAGIAINSARRQRDAVQTVVEQYGSVSYEYEVKFSEDGFHIPISEEQYKTWKWIPLPSSWKSGLLKDLEWNVVMVDYSDTFPPGQSLDAGAEKSNYQLLTRFKYLRSLNFENCHLEELLFIKDLPYLNHLNLRLSQPCNLDSLSQLQDLQVLTIDLYQPTIADKEEPVQPLLDFEPLESLTNLNSFFYEQSNYLINKYDEHRLERLHRGSPDVLTLSKFDQVRITDPEKY